MHRIRPNDMRVRRARLPRGGLAACALCASAGSFAQLPLSIEELLVEDSVLKLSTQANGFRAYQPVLGLVDGAPGESARAAVTWRALEGSNSALALRYGLSRRVELNALVERSRLRWDAPGGGRIAQQRERLSLGGSWLAVREGARRPALLLDATVDLYQRGSAQVRARDGLLPGAYGLGVTAYHALDPVVLSLSARYQQRSAAADPAGIAGSSWLLAPQVNFSVNPQVTLIGGVSLREEQSSLATVARGFASALRLGVGYAPDRRHTLFMQADLGITGGDTTGLSFEWLYQF